MGRFVAVRLFHALIVLIVVVVLVFIFARLMPGDALLVAVVSSNIDVDTAKAVATLRAQYGLDQPVYYQFFRWLTDFFIGDWGESIGTGEDVLDMFLERLPVTLQLFLWAAVWAYAIGIPIGIVGALRRNTKTDMALTTAALIGVSIPAFFEALILIYLLAVLLPIFPPSGFVPFGDDAWGNIMSMAMPGFVAGTGGAGLIARYVRSSLLEVMRQDYIRTARAKGLPESAVVRHHAMRPAMIPVVTVIGLAWTGVLGGLFIIEVIFALPGLGRMTVDAIFQKDFPVIQATLIVASLNVLLVNLAVDIVYGYLDPRVRVQ